MEEALNSLSIQKSLPGHKPRRQIIKLHKSPSESIIYRLRNKEIHQFLLSSLKSCNQATKGNKSPVTLHFDVLRMIATEDESIVNRCI